MSTEKRSLTPLLVSGVLVCAAIGGGVWFWLQDDPQPDPPLVKIDLEQVKLDKNQAIALLENSKYDEAAEILEKLAEQIPTEELPIRNLAIARLLPIVTESVTRHAEADRYSQLVAHSQSALDQLDSVTDSAALVHFFQSKLALLEEDRETAMAEARKAIAADPNDAIAAYALFRIVEHSIDPAHNAVKLEALQLAHQRSPDNLWVIPMLLTSQAQTLVDQAKNETSEITTDAITQTIAAFMKHTAVFPAKIRADANKYLEAAAAAVGKQDWPTLQRNCRFVQNITRPQKAVQIDRRAIDPHLLEYVLEDFSPEFEQSLAKTPEEGQRIEVRFQTPERSQQLPESADVRFAKLIDVDLDDRPEAILVRENGFQVLSFAVEDGWRVVMETQVSGMSKLLAVDLDFDAPMVECCDKQRTDVDFVLFGPAGVRLFENLLDAQAGTRSLVDRTPEALLSVKDVIDCAAADLDHDSDLDLMLLTKNGVQIWSNVEALGGPRKRRTGHYQFVDISDRSSFGAFPSTARTLLPVDWNHDLSIDVIVAGGPGDPIGYLENLRHARFRWKTIETEQPGPVCLGDFDLNTSWDLVASGKDGIHHIRSNFAIPGVTRVQPASKLADGKVDGWVTLDFDNDGYLDCLGFDNSGAVLLAGTVSGGLEVREDVLPNEFAARSIEAGDIDRDGDLDLLTVSSDGKAEWLRNDGGNANKWIDIRLHADPLDEQFPSNHINMHAIGSTLELKSKGIYQKRLVTSPTTHFGLGQQDKVDIIRAVWTDGVPYNQLGLAAGGNICVKQILQGSCPYIYTWNGERFVFLTDGLWNAPIGLQLAEGVLAPSREWEYLAIQPEQLKPANGEYRLQFTEELFEAVYFEEVKLFAVDHPQDVRIFTNEKVGPATIAEHKIHTVRQPRTPVSAKNHVGRDVLPQIAKRDDDYSRVFEQRIMRGRTEDYYLELDLGAVTDPDNVKLFLTGWMLPSGTSTNVALSQDTSLSNANPASVSIPDSDGQWKNVIPFMGFPGGKTKTIVVDLSGKFASDDFRLRIHSNFEINWDHIFFTSGEEPVEQLVQECELKSADLHYRGFSKREPQFGYPSNNGPENYNYDSVSKALKWPPMQGRFTRYADVASLIRESDDQLVVMGAGDEMTLRFAMPKEELPAGWTRSFVLYNVGWDKDADPNTVLGSTVEPLPFRGMSAYPFAAEERTPDSDEYRRYLRTYQTREQTPKRFWSEIRQFELFAN